MSGISKKPKKTGVLTENDIDALINKGGDVPAKEKTKVAKKPAAKKKVVKKPAKKIPVQLRLSQDLLDVIDGIIDNRVVKISRHAWFLEAIAEKIEKEN